MYHHDQVTISVSTQQPLGAMRTNFTQVGPMRHVLIHYNKDMILDTDKFTDTLAYLWRIFLKILMKSEVTFFENPNVSTIFCIFPASERQTHDPSSLTAPGLPQISIIAAHYAPRRGEEREKKERERREKEKKGEEEKKIRPLGWLPAAGCRPPRGQRRPTRVRICN